MRSGVRWTLHARKQILRKTLDVQADHFGNVGEAQLRDVQRFAGQARRLNRFTAGGLHIKMRCGLESVAEQCERPFCLSSLKTSLPNNWMPQRDSGMRLLGRARVMPAPTDHARSATSAPRRTAKSTQKKPAKSGVVRVGRLLRVVQTTRLGFEPRMREPKSLVLPLHYRVSGAPNSPAAVLFL